MILKVIYDKDTDSVTTIEEVTDLDDDIVKIVESDGVYPYVGPSYYQYLIEPNKFFEWHYGNKNEGNANTISKRMRSVYNSVKLFIRKKKINKILYENKS